MALSGPEKTSGNLKQELLNPNRGLINCCFQDVTWQTLMLCG